MKPRTTETASETSAILCGEESGTTSDESQQRRPLRPFLSFTFFLVCIAVSLNEICQEQSENKMRAVHNGIRVVDDKSEEQSRRIELKATLKDTANNYPQPRTSLLLMHTCTTHPGHKFSSEIPSRLSRCSLQSSQMQSRYC